MAEVKSVAVMLVSNGITSKGTLFNVNQAPCVVTAQLDEPAAFERLVDAEADIWVRVRHNELPVTVGDTVPIQVIPWRGYYRLKPGGREFMRGEYVSVIEDPHMLGIMPTVVERI